MKITLIKINSTAEQSSLSLDTAMCSNNLLIPCPARRFYIILFVPMQGGRKGINVKLASTMFSNLIEIHEAEVFSLILENKALFRTYLEDLYAQADGQNGKIVLSENNIPIPISKNVEIIDTFIPFNINTKHMLSCICSVLEAAAADEEHYLKTAEFLSYAEKYIDDLCFSLPFRPECKRLSVSSFLKAAQVCIENDYNSTIEAVTDYMTLIRDFDKTKLFVLVNFGSYFSDSEINMFIRTVRLKQMRVLMLESRAYTAVTGVKRLIIDEDLCEF